jgi:Peptidase family S41
MMRTLAVLSCAVLALVAPAGGAEPAPDSRQETDNVAAFARLYGVVRYFYPSDGAVGLDWNAFAVHGVKSVRPARDASALRAALDSLVAPLGPGIEIAARLSTAPAARGGPDLVAWRYLGPGFATGGPYRGKRTRRAAAATIDGFVTVMQTVPADTLRGKAIRLSGRVRATASEPSGSGALWLRVDRPDRAMGFFDNMGDRPIREAEWREYTIEGTVADDAAAVAFGVMASGAVIAEFDAIGLVERATGGPWTAVPIADSGFEAAANDARPGWFRAGNSKGALISRPTEGAPEGRQVLRFSPPASGADDGDLFAVGSPAIDHADVELGPGLRARVPLALTEAEAQPEEPRKARLESLMASLRGLAATGDRPDLDVRLADVVVAWNVFRHFYPYWPETGVDWDTHLRPHLEAARADGTRAQHRDTLRALVADARDGHGFVGDKLSRAEPGSLPIRLAAIEGRLVIAASDAPEAPVGALVTAIDGVPASERLDREMRLLSGTAQWRQARAAQELGMGEKGSTVRLRLDTSDGARDVALRCAATTPPEEKRPASLVELEPGVWYVDLTRATQDQVKPSIGRLAEARGVVFDLRGYPTDAGAGILPHLLDSPENGSWMHVAKLVGPFGQSAGWESQGWNMSPAAPKLRGRIAFLTDGSAISYAESVMGHVSDLKLGHVVGGVTAGTNGNVATFDLPGGFIVGFTGMRVTGHDGRTPFHLVGVRPDLAVAPTLAGLRAGRDEVLERALEFVRAPR